MKKYSKEELRKIDRFDLFDIQYAISDKVKIGAIINVILCALTFLMKDSWVKTGILCFTTAMTVYLLIQLIRFIRIEKILHEDDSKSMPKQKD